MPCIAIIYATNELQTEKIARTIARHFHEHGLFARTYNLSKIDPYFSLIGFDAVLIGASVHFGRHQPSVSKFVQNHHTALSSIHSGFFSVSLSAAGESIQQRQDAIRFMQNFKRVTRWNPNSNAIFAGALQYREYGVVKKRWMKLIASRSGGDTDTSSNHEYTNWDHVAAFAEDFANQLKNTKESTN